MLDHSRVWIRLYGPFMLMIGDCEVWISSRKAQAVLAMLAMAPNGERTRAWLCGHLWSSRAPEQARGSLRRELSTLRARHPILSRALTARGDRVGLDLSICHIDAHAPAPARLGPDNFLEGLDIPGEDAFEDWLRAMRASIRSVQPPRHSIPCAVRPAATERLGAQNQARYCIGLLPPEIIGSALETHFVGHDLLDRIGQELTNRGGMAIFDCRDSQAGLAPAPADASATPAHGGAAVVPTGPDATLHLRLIALGDGRVQASARLLLAGSRALIWSRQSQIRNHLHAQDDIDAMIFLNEAAEEILFALSAQAGLDDARHRAACHATAAVHQAFGLQPGSIEAAHARFGEAYRLTGDAVYLAWLAYLLSFKLENDGEKCFGKEGEGVEMARRALEAAPYNTQCIALLIHVFGFAMRDFARAGQLVDQGKALGAENIMFFDSTALFHIYTNRPDLARKPAQIAAEMGRFLPYRYVFETTLCMIDTLEGRFEQAVARGRRVLDAGPGPGAPPFAPALRYLATSHYKLGQSDQAAGYLSQLRAKEPNLSHGLVDDRLYPLPSDQARALFSRTVKEIAA